PGVRFIRSRVKGVERLREKLAGNREPDVISDYLGARVAFESEDSVPSIMQSLERQGFEVIEVDNFLNNPRVGYRAVHVQIRRPGALSVEIQMAPQEIAAVQIQAHAELEIFRNPTVSTAQREAAVAKSEAIFGEAFARFQERQGRPAVPVGEPARFVPPVREPPPPPHRGSQGLATADQQNVLRIDVADFDPNISKPQGTYFSILDDVQKSPNLDVGNTVFRGRVQTEKILEVSAGPPIQHARFRGVTARSEGEISAGVSALRKLVSPQEFERLRAASKPQLIEELSQRFPGPDYNRFFDSYELLEAYGAQVAREKGFDALRLIEPQAPEFSEFVALNPRAVRITQKAPLEPPGPSIPPPTGPPPPTRG
ncbi:hypothetical protein LCGC14_2976270, partial [marine sediment metagenome]